MGHNGGYHRARIKGADLLHAVGSADLVVEAIPEKLSLKEALYKTLAHFAPAHCIFAMNRRRLYA